MKDFDVIFRGEVKDVYGNWQDMSLRFSNGKSHKDFVDSNKDKISAHSMSEIVPKEDEDE